MQRKTRIGWLATAAVLLLILPPAYLLNAERPDPDSEPLRVLGKYLKLLYARDFNQAYRFISAEDQKIKSVRVYVKEKGPFSGFASELARELAEEVEISPVDQQWEGERLRIKLAMKLPDANAVAPLVLNWDEEKLNTLPQVERSKMLNSLEKLKRDGKLKRIDVEEEFLLVKQGGQWKLFLDWAAGAKVTFQTTVPSAVPIEMKLLQSEVLARQGDLFNVTVRMRNTSKETVTARIGHLVDPHEVRDYLDLVECGFLLPVRLLPGREEEFITTYLLRAGLPEEIRRLTVTYAVTLQQ